MRELYHMDMVQKYWRETLVAGLILANIVVWVAVLERGGGDTLHVYFIDVGQGDAIFIESPSDKQILIDGGKNRQILSELGRIMSFGDRYIDVVLETHPDMDHAGGLVFVRERYEVGLSLDQSTARRGMSINFGDGARLNIFFPDRDVSTWDTNDGSVIAELVYGESEFLLTGDAGLRTESILMSLDKAVLDTDVLKVGHHGSRTSTSLDFARATSPEYAVISAGRDNSYGHPHAQVINILEQVDTTILGTYNLGTIHFVSNGETLEIK